MSAVSSVFPCAKFLHIQPESGSGDIERRQPRRITPRKIFRLSLQPPTGSPHGYTSKPNWEGWFHSTESCRDDIKPPSPSPVLSHSHDSPLSTPCPPRRALGHWGGLFLTATSSSIDATPTRCWDPAHFRLERDTPFPVVCTNGSRPPIIFAIHLPLAYPRGPRSRQRALDSRRGVRRHLGGVT